MGTTCLSCGKHVKSKKLLYDHTRQMGKFHDGKCRICPDFEAAIWSQNLKHFNEFHKGEIQYKCGFCPEYFNTQLQIQVHVRLNCQGEKNKHHERLNNVTTCDECGISIKKIQLRQHKLSAHPKEGQVNFPCKNCCYVFSDKQSLSSHKPHCKNRKDNKTKYQCDQCEFMGNQSHLQVHKLSKHTPDHLKPYRCSFCPKGFAFKRHLEVHENVHTGNKPYECKYCGMKFASDGNMNGHIRQTRKGIKRNTSKYVVAKS